MRLPPILFFIALSLMAGGTASAQGGGHLRAELVAGVEAIAPGAPFTAAVSFEMEEGWHIYWRNPGDAGLATGIEWNLPDGFTVESLGWPLPHLFGEAPEVTYGYAGKVMLPVRITPPSTLKPGSTVELSAAASWLVCKEACVPGRATLSARLPVMARPRANAVVDSEIMRAAASAPGTSPGSRITAVGTDSGYVIRIEESRGSHAGSMFLPYYESVIDHSARQRVEKVGGATLIHLVASPFATERAKRLQGVLVEMDGEHPAARAGALEIDLAVDAGTP
jgi:thiol:disulfide interchange protein DsbD